LPGTSGFVGEFLILVGSFQINYIVAMLATTGVILSAAYMLWLYRRVVFGKIINSELKKMKDLNISELYILYPLALLIILFGFYPEPFFNSIEVSINNLIDNYNMNLNYHLLKR
jgi:NADH-quinone oxidoreductase subunit M